jgi:hypothetical protein
MLAAKRVFCIEEYLYMRRVRAGSLMTGDATARQVDSLFYIYVWTVEKVSEKEYPSGVTEALKLFAKRRYTQALEIYSLLSVAEKEKIGSSLDMEYKEYVEKTGFSATAPFTFNDKTEKLLKENIFIKILKNIKYNGLISFFKTVVKKTGLSNKK